jgi:hypothetical protein
MSRENELVQILAAQVGKDRYLRAREKAWRTAADVGHINRGTTPPGEAGEDDAAEMVPHELADWIWYDA